MRKVVIAGFAVMVSISALAAPLDKAPPDKAQGGGWFNAPAPRDMRGANQNGRIERFQRFDNAEREVRGGNQNARIEGPRFESAERDQRGGGEWISRRLAMVSARLDQVRMSVGEAKSKAERERLSEMAKSLMAELRMLRRAHETAKRGGLIDSAAKG